MKNKKDVAAVVLGFVVAVIIWITILGRDTKVASSTIYQSLGIFHFNLADITKNGIRGNFLGNILLFIPLGIVLPVVSNKEQKCYRTILGGLTLSLFVETTQLITSRGYFEIDDMILNSFGTALGYVGYCIVMWCITRINCTR